MPILSHLTFGPIASVWATGAILRWAHRLGGPGLIFLGIVDNSLIPVPGSMDAFVVLISAYHREWWPYYALMATAGAVLGGFLTFRLGEKGGEQTLQKKLGKKAQRVYGRFRKHGFATIALSAVIPPPFPMAPVLLAAGALHYPRKRFLTSLALGRSVRFFVLAYLGHLYGGAIISVLSEYYRPLLYALIGIAAAGGMGALLYFKWFRPKRRREETVRGETPKRFSVPVDRAEDTTKGGNERNSHRV